MLDGYLQRTLVVDVGTKMMQVLERFPDKEISMANGFSLTGMAKYEVPLGDASIGFLHLVLDGFGTWFVHVQDEHADPARNLYNEIMVAPGAELSQIRHEELVFRSTHTVSGGGSALRTRISNPGQKLLRQDAKLDEPDKCLAQTFRQP